MDFGDFAKQIPISILLAPFFFGFLYIVLMVYIFQRARKRRKAKQEAALAASQAGGGQQEPALSDIPEPDFDALFGGEVVTPADEPVRVVPEKPATVSQPMPQPTPQPKPTPQAAPASAPVSEPDWLSAVSPSQEIVPTMTAPTASSADYDPSAPLPEDAVEVMRIYRDLSDGRIIVQINNNNYRALGDIKSPDLARRFTAVVRELWAMINPANAPQTQTGSHPAVAPAEQAKPKSRIGLLNNKPDEEEKPKPNIMRQFARAAMGQSSVTSSEPTGIAGAVEEFLQFKLSNTPSLAMRSIHIRPSPDHGIRIEVDGKSYDGIGDVTDAEVREFLQNMMREWEARQ